MAQTKKSPTRSTTKAFGSSYGKKGSINWKVAGPLIVVAVVGAFGLWKLIDSFAATPSSNIIYHLDSTNYDINGDYILAKDGSDTYIGRYITFDVSNDGNWLLVENNLDDGSMKLGAVSTATKEFIPYVDGRRGCIGTDGVHDSLNGAKFGPSNSATEPPVIYYDLYTTNCDDARYLSSAVYRVKVGQSRETIAKTNSGDVSFHLADVASNETVVFSKNKDNNDDLDAVFVKTKAGKMYTLKSTSSPSLSYDGKKLAYQSTKTYRYFVADINGKNKKALKVDNNAGSALLLNNDGSKFVYQNISKDYKQVKLNVYNVRSDKKLLLDTVVTQRQGSSIGTVECDWSKDGTELVYQYINKPDNKYQLRTISASGKNRKIVKNFDLSSTRFLTPYWR